MKTPRILTFALVLSGVVALSASAQPPSKRPSPRRPPPAETPAERREVGTGELTCETMRVPNPGNTKQPYRTVVCTPEMMENDPRCQRACGKS